MSTTGHSIGSVKEAALILGDKWTPELLRFFVNEEKVGFCQLQDLTGGINPRTLSHRLATLERYEIIEKHTLPSSSRCRYQLTKKGRDLVPVLLSMQAWSEKYTK
jgi:DNA-binding HxlR family transcriptional regulator